MSGQPIRIGYCLSLTGPLASNGKTARLTHQIWEKDVNRKRGLLGREVQMVCIDDETNPKLVPEIYKRLLDDEKVDLLIGGYGDNSVSSAMPLIIERNRYLVALMALATNASLGYANYFVMIPTGPRPSEALTDGFFNLAANQSPKPDTMAILAADALFSKSPVQGAKAHADKHNFRVVSEALYPLSTTDLASFIRPLESVNPDILFFCSYLNDSAGLLRALNEVRLEPKIVGGAMIGPQNGSIKAQLGPLLNGIVNYEYWLPVPKMMYPGIAQMMAKYQSLAQDAGADPLGYYVAPQAYAQMQIVEQAIVGTNSLDDAKLAQFTRDTSFKTILGDVKFGPGGGWSEARVLQVQYLGTEEQQYVIRSAVDPGRYMATKMFTSFPANLANGNMPAVQAVCVLFDGSNGRPLAVMGATEITHWRTAADSALGAKFLARPDAEMILVVGAGEMSRWLVRAHMTVQPSLRRVLIWNRTIKRACNLATHLKRDGLKAEIVSDLDAATRQADIITTCTRSHEPLIKGVNLRPGVHLDLVGGYTPQTREADNEAARRSRVFVDRRESAFDGVGDIMQPIASGAIREADVLGDLYDLASGTVTGRLSEKDITFFKNAGGGHLDLITCETVFRQLGAKLG